MGGTYLGGRWWYPGVQVSPTRDGVWPPGCPLAGPGWVSWLSLVPGLGGLAESQSQNG